MDSAHSSWTLDYGLMDDVHASDFLWAPQIVNDQTFDSTAFGLDVSCKGEPFPQNSSSRKRALMESCAGQGTKACREKKRRDRLNDRFLELCKILDPVRPPKTDKVAILCDATRLLNQLRVEAEELKEKNEALQDTIKNLKAEKVELRDEKVRLKAEKERMEQIVQAISVPSHFIPHPSATALATTFHAAAFVARKTIPYPNYPTMGMWQWMPPSSLDTSQDHFLRPPVA